MTVQNTPLERLPVVAVIGASQASQKVEEIAVQIGVAIRREGWHLMTGGGTGIMEAACRGFHSAAKIAGELTIGILPSDDPSFANPFVDVAIPSGMGWARNAIITRAASGVIAIGGCSGTLSEIAFAWQMGKPIVALSASGGWAAEMAGRAIDDRRDDVIFSAHSPFEAVEFLKQRMLP